MFIAAAGLAVAMAGCEKKASTGDRVAKVVSVAVAKAQQRKVPLQFKNFGAVEAYSTVSVKSMVGGVVTEVHFTEGEMVKQGQRLFTIDPRPYEAAMRQAESVLARDEANQKSAELEAKRVVSLHERGAATPDERDKTQFAAEALRGTVAADRAVLDNAKLQLEYCYIRSPIEGRVGRILIQKGNVVKANDLALVSIMQVKPIYVAFSLPQQELPTVRQFQASHPLQVTVQIPGHENESIQGELTFIDNTVDPATGTIRVMATVANETLRLWPGLFVNVVLNVTHNNSILVPTTAVQPGQTGDLVYVVQDDQSVLAQPVVVDRVLEGGMTSLQKGLAEGQVVVTDGQFLLAPGVKVDIKNPQALTQSSEAASQPEAASQKSSRNQPS